MLKYPDTDVDKFKSMVSTNGSLSGIVVGYFLFCTIKSPYEIQIGR